MQILTLAVLALVGVSTPALAHDGNLARWDVTPEPATVEVRLVTAGTAVHQNLIAASPASVWDPVSPDEYKRRLKQHLSETVLLTEGGSRLELTDIEPVYGHEMSVRMRFTRTASAPAGDLRLDLGGFSPRPNQHHLVFVYAGQSRQRTMLSPGEPYVLTWSSPPASPPDLASLQESTHD